MTILYCLLPNATHILQPADVSVFRSLKVHWKETIRECQIRPENINNHLTKITFAPLDSNAVDYSKCVKSTLEDVANTNRCESNLQVDAQTIDFTKVIICFLASQFEKIGVNVDTVVNILEKAKKELLAVFSNTEKESNMLNTEFQLIDNIPIVTEGLPSGKI